MTGDSTPDGGPESTASTGRRGLLVRVVASVATALILIGRFLFVAGRFVAVGAALVGATLTDDGVQARARRWFLLDGNRWVIAGGLTVLTFVGTFLLFATNLLGAEQGGFVTTMFSAVISGLFSFVPIVVSVNQLTVSRVVGSISEIEEQMESARGFQRQVASMGVETDIVSTKPAPFLGAVISLLRNRAEGLQRAVDDASAPLQAAVDEYVAVLQTQAGHVESRFDGDRQRLGDLLVPMMGDNYPQNVQDARRIETSYADELSDHAREQLSDLRDLSITLDLLRQYYKAMYIQQELSRLSRWIGYTGIGAFFVAIVVVMGFAQGHPFPGWPLLLDLAVSFALASVVLPFAVLLSFVVKIATITARTAAPGPFTPLRETPAYARHRDD